MLDERWDIDKERSEEYSLLKNKEWTLFMLNERWDTTELSKEERSEEYIRLLKIKNEERSIVEHLVRKLDFNGSPCDSTSSCHYIMTRDMRIYEAHTYKSSGVSPSDAYVYIFDNFYYAPPPPDYYYHPFIAGVVDVIDAYLSKLGFYGYQYYMMPATGLKYVVHARRFLSQKRVVIEIADIDTVVSNLNLPTIVRNVLGSRYDRKYVNADDFWGIVANIDEQKLLAGYDITKVYDIVNGYYRSNGTKFVKEFQAIRDAYNRIFRPLHFVYDMGAKQFQESDCS